MNLPPGVTVGKVLALVVLVVAILMMGSCFHAESLRFELVMVGNNYPFAMRIDRKTGIVWLWTQHSGEFTKVDVKE